MQMRGDGSNYPLGCLLAAGFSLFFPGCFSAVGVCSFLPGCLSVAGIGAGLRLRDRQWPYLPIWILPRLER
jgi:hypothetical protein